MAGKFGESFLLCEKSILGGITVLFCLWISIYDEVTLEAAAPILTLSVGKEVWMAVPTSRGWNVNRNAYIEGLNCRGTALPLAFFYYMG